MISPGGRGLIMVVTESEPGLEILPFLECGIVIVGFANDALQKSRIWLGSMMGRPA
jgi:hypothetical protein